MNLQIRPTTPEDVAEFYGSVPQSFVGLTATLDGKIAGIGGVYRHGTALVAFTEMRDIMRGRKKDIVRCTRAFLEFIADKVVYAAPNCGEHPNAEAFLRRVGFVPTAAQSEFGRIYRRAARCG